VRQVALLPPLVSALQAMPAPQAAPVMPRPALSLASVRVLNA
jgi:hypothetical protein